jgi:hypothetical protein
MLRLIRGPFARDIVTLRTAALAADAVEIGPELVGLSVESPPVQRVIGQV